jgi:hypothetical protein
LALYLIPNFWFCTSVLNPLAIFLPDFQMPPSLMSWYLHGTLYMEFLEYTCPTFRWNKHEGRRFWHSACAFSGKPGEVLRNEEVWAFSVARHCLIHLHSQVLILSLVPWCSLSESLANQTGCFCSLGSNAEQQCKCSMMHNGSLSHLPCCPLSTDERLCRHITLCSWVIYTDCRILQDMWFHVQCDMDSEARTCSCIRGEGHRHACGITWVTVIFSMCELIPLLMPFTLWSPETFMVV